MGTIHRNLLSASTHLRPEHYDPCPRYLFARAFTAEPASRPSEIITICSTTMPNWQDSCVINTNRAVQAMVRTDQVDRVRDSWL